MNSKRYSRQTVLPEIGAEGQRRLDRARILCVGVGGLGSPAALYLTAAGIGHIGLIDADRVDVSNLQRQVLFEDADQGLLKVDAAKNRLQRLNPDVEIATYPEAFNEANAMALLQNYDLILDGSDNFETKFLVNDAAYKRGIPVVYAAVNRFEGQVALFWGNRGSCYRCLYPAPPKAAVRNCAEAGVLGAVVGTMGTLQATLALQYFISAAEPRHPLCPQVGALTLFDFAGSWNTTMIDVPKRDRCPTCARPPEEITLHCAAPACEAIETLSVEELQSLLNKPHEGLLLIDVRTHEEWHDGHIAGAIHWPLARLVQGELPRIQTHHTLVVLYCKSGMRSAQASKIFMTHGLGPVRNLSGGIDLWGQPLSH